MWYCEYHHRFDYPWICSSDFVWVKCECFPMSFEHFLKCNFFFWQEKFVFANTQLLSCLFGEGMSNSYPLSLDPMLLPLFFSNDPQVVWDSIHFYFLVHYLYLFIFFQKYYLYFVSTPTISAMILQLYSSMAKYILMEYI